MVDTKQQTTGEGSKRVSIESSAQRSARTSCHPLSRLCLLRTSPSHPVTCLASSQQYITDQQRYAPPVAYVGFIFHKLNVKWWTLIFFRWFWNLVRQLQCWCLSKVDNSFLSFWSISNQPACVGHAHSCTLWLNQPFCLYGRKKLRSKFLNNEIIVSSSTSKKENNCQSLHNLKKEFFSLKILFCLFLEPICCDPPLHPTTIKDNNISGS